MTRLTRPPAEGNGTALPSTAPPLEPLAIERPDGMHLRVELAEYNGHRFVNVRLWYQSREGEWRPSNKGLSLKMRELGRVAAKLSEIARATGTDREPKGGAW